MEPKTSGKGFYLNVILFSIAFLFIGNFIATRGMEERYDPYAPDFFYAVVTNIVDRREVHHDIWGDGGTTNIYVDFTARITRGEFRGTEVTAVHSIFEGLIPNEQEVREGDRVVLVYLEFNDQYFFANHVRINYIMILGAIFFVLMLWFGRQKGLNAIIALVFTCMSVFFVLVPAIVAGRNIYMVTIIVCAYVILSTLLTVLGPGKKAVASILGCFGGVLLAGVLMLFADMFISLTGFVDHDTLSLTMLDTPIDLRALIFAGVIIGAVGAIMDVSLSISTSLWELREAGVGSFDRIFRSGLNIGKDILGTMLNTLVLAYIGSSLSLILLITVHTASFTELFNSEMVIVEFLRAMVGSFGMFLAIPLTAAVCGWLYENSSGYGE